MNVFEYNELLTIQEYADFDLHIPNNECCICMSQMRTFKDGIRLPCCNNFIHPCCLIETFTRVSTSCCPLCRCEMRTIIYKMNKVDSVLFRHVAKLLIDSDIIEKEYTENQSSYYAKEHKYKVLQVLNILSKYYNNIEDSFVSTFMFNMNFMMKH